VARQKEQKLRLHEHLAIANGAPATDHEEAFRHGHWRERRHRVREVLERINTNAFALDRFKNCGSECTVEYSKSLDRARLRANYCHCRHCEPCQRAKANKIARNLEKRLEQRPAGRYRFLTFTLKHSNTPLAEQIRRLYACFKKLRQDKRWKKTQAGGCFMLEVKHSETGWHPHLHVISEGSFIGKQELSNLWKEKTGDSFICDIRSLEDDRAAAHYVTKYITKGTSNDVWNNIDLATEWCTATKGVRACATFGTWRGFRLNAVTKLADDWQAIDRLDCLVRKARAGDEMAWNLLVSLRPPGESEIDLCTSQ
jgi:hypothetical protein